MRNVCDSYYLLGSSCS